MYIRKALFETHSREKAFWYAILMRKKKISKTMNRGKFLTTFRKVILNWVRNKSSIIIAMHGFRDLYLACYVVNCEEIK